MCVTPLTHTHTPLPAPPKVATDYRLWLVGQVEVMRSEVGELMRVAADRSEAEVEVLMPGEGAGRGGGGGGGAHAGEGREGRGRGGRGRRGRLSAGEAGMRAIESCVLSVNSKD